MLHEIYRRVNVRNFHMNDNITWAAKPLPATIPSRFETFTRSSQNFASLPISYCFGVTNELYVDDPIDALFSSSYNESSWSSNSHRTQSPISEIKYLRSRSSEPRLEGFRHPAVDYDECSIDSGFSARKFLPKIPVQKTQTHLGFFSNFATIPSVDSESQLFDIDASKVSTDSSLDSPGLQMKSCTLTEGYFNENLKKELLNRSHSLIADDQIIDVAYDSDTGWQKTNVRRNPFKQEPKRERLFSRESLKLELKRNDRAKSSAWRARRHSRSLTREDHVESISDTDSKPLPAKPKQELSNKALKQQLEGQVVSPKMNDDLIKQPNSRADVVHPSKADDSQKKVFDRCLKSSVPSNEGLHKSGGEELTDDVFDKSQNASFHGKNKIEMHNADRRSSSLEALSTVKPKKSKSRGSSVSIDDQPKYCDDEPLTNCSKNASSHAIAQPSINPARGSLKKTPSTNSKSSDYDRDRGRSRHMDSGHRESFKKNARTNERGSDQDRDASDRELKDPLNRSLSNTDTHLEDRIGERQVKCSKLLTPPHVDPEHSHS